MDKQLTIEEGNIAIAGFMGEKLFVKPDGEVRIWRGNNRDYNFKVWAKYHSSWDWLMPVVEKIITYEFPLEDDLPFGADTAYLRTFGMINNDTGKKMVRFNRFGINESSSIIEATWLAVIEFIQWYNNQS